KKLMSLTLNSVPSITSRGLLSVAIGCNSLSALHLIDCKKISSGEWLEYLGWNGSLEELVVRNCNRIRQPDLLKFGPGWMKLWKFEFESKDLRLVHIQARSELRLCLLLEKCKALEKLCLKYVVSLTDNDMIALSHSCNNLKSISLWLMPPQYVADDNDFLYIPSVTDHSLQVLALGCPMLQSVELTFHEGTFYLPDIGLTLECVRILIQSCQILVLVLNGADFFDDEGMMVLSSSPFLETLELAVNDQVTDAGMHSIARTPCLRSLTLRLCSQVTDAGLTELVHSQKLDSLTIEGCACISPQVAQGAARSVHYSLESASRSRLSRI
uniref:F-box domain-containing protein n=1 Tax=Aegilops tauschii subsp. strangulata TaxID=200361 RepID=A0A453K0M0_AEGTS